MAALAFDHAGLESSFHTDNRFRSGKGRWNVPLKREKCQYFLVFLQFFRKLWIRFFSKNLVDKNYLSD
jgi:hypothetical protein